MTPLSALNGTRRRRGFAGVGAACLLVASLAVAAVAQAQSTQTGPAPSTKDSSLTWNGITFYGIIDIGLQYITHSAPFSDYFPAGSGDIIQKNSRPNSATGVTPNNLSQSRLGLSGNEHLWGDWSGVFKLETFFQPDSGNLSDALKSLALNNGKALNAQNVGVDSSVAGQLFQGAAYAGFASKSFGQITFGRQVTLIADNINTYDPMTASQAFSVIGLSGTTAGGGDTEDRRLDHSVKYDGRFQGAHLGLMYQFPQAGGSENSAYQAVLGYAAAGFSADAYYGKKYNAISASSLSAAQVAALPAQGLSPSNSLAATISDNTDYGLGVLYNFGKAEIFAGYEHVNFENPKTPYPTPVTAANAQVTIGGYVLAVVNNTAFPTTKTLQIYWGGVKFMPRTDLDLIVAYYGYTQNSYGIGANAGCSDARAATCSGNLYGASAVIDYHFTKRFDTYFGSMWTEVKNGLANGYLLATYPDSNSANTIATTWGIRFKW